MKLPCMVHMIVPDSTKVGWIFASFLATNQKFKEKTLLFAWNTNAMDVMD